MKDSQFYAGHIGDRQNQLLQKKKMAYDILMDEFPPIYERIKDIK